MCELIRNTTISTPTNTNCTDKPRHKIEKAVFDSVRGVSHVYLWWLRVHFKCRKSEENADHRM